MKKGGFTLLELIIVIIIIGVLATLGFAQYGRMIEKSRGAEARMVSGTIRTLSAAYRLENGNSLAGFAAANAGIGAATDQIPSACRGTHYFSYALTPDPVVSTTQLVVTAARCTASGKSPNAAAANTLILTAELSTGSDTWGGNGGY